MPAGVLNIVTASRNEAEIFLKHPAIKGVSFVGSTSVGLHIYSTAAGNGKRVQALTEAKNHALVLRDAIIERTAQGIINSFCGCAGERCMALPVVVAENAIADELVEAVARLAKGNQTGPGIRQDDRPGPRGKRGAQEIRAQLDRDGASRKAQSWFSTGAIQSFRRSAQRAPLSGPPSSIT